ncbi:LysR substrate-binding domain-containing protein, partial [Klebsiella pneumoniae]|uniref:LysR substrate-binding domain-containing protein n=1 Tax=Klebsiella pneumoniae TaxID=573 RepID=UPI0009CDC0C9
WEKQKGSRGIRRGQWYRLVFQFPIREPGSGTGRLLTEYFGELGVPRSGMQLGSTEAVKQAVRAGLGVSLVMASAVQDEVRSGALVALPIPGLEKRLQLIWRKPPGNLHPPGFVRHLLEEADLAG